MDRIGTLLNAGWLLRIGGRWLSAPDGVVASISGLLDLSEKEFQDYVDSHASLRSGTFSIDRLEREREKLLTRREARQGVRALAWRCEYTASRDRFDEVDRLEREDACLW